MKFRTEVHIPISEKKILLTDSIFSVGSCFAGEMSPTAQKRTNANALQSFWNDFSTHFR